MILVKRINVIAFKVIVRDDNSETLHKVILRDGDFTKLSDGIESKEDLIKRSFEFLLSREPKESILREFELVEISKYFPEFEDVLKS